MEIVELRRRITRDLNIWHGKPVICGPRYPMATVLEWLASEMTPEEGSAYYPARERKNLQAASLYAARLPEVKGVVLFLDKMARKTLLPLKPYIDRATEMATLVEARYEEQHLVLDCP